MLAFEASYRGCTLILVLKIFKLDILKLLLDIYSLKLLLDIYSRLKLFLAFLHKFTFTYNLALVFHMRHDGSPVLILFVFHPIIFLTLDFNLIFP